MITSCIRLPEVLPGCIDVHKVQLMALGGPEWVLFLAAVCGSLMYAVLIWCTQVIECAPLVHQGMPVLVHQMHGEALWINQSCCTNYWTIGPIYGVNYYIARWPSFKLKTSNTKYELTGYWGTSCLITTHIPVSAGWSWLGILLHEQCYFFLQGIAATETDSWEYDVLFFVMILKLIVYTINAPHIYHLFLIAPTLSEYCKRVFNLNGGFLLFWSLGFSVNCHCDYSVYHEFAGVSESSLHSYDDPAEIMELLNRIRLM